MKPYTSVITFFFTTKGFEEEVIGWGYICISFVSLGHFLPRRSLSLLERRQTVYIIVSERASRRRSSTEFI